LADGRWAPPEARDHHDDDAWCFAAEIWALRTFLNLESDDTTWSATLWEYQRRNGCTGAVILCLTSFLVAALNSVEEHTGRAWRPQVGPQLARLIDMQAAAS
jgi:hypothetical protein